MSANATTSQKAHGCHYAGRVKPRAGLCDAKEVPGRVAHSNPLLAHIFGPADGILITYSAVESTQFDNLYLARQGSLRLTLTNSIVSSEKRSCRGARPIADRVGVISDAARAGDRVAFADIAGDGSEPDLQRGRSDQQVLEDDRHAVRFRPALSGSGAWAIPVADRFTPSLRRSFAPVFLQNCRAQICGFSAPNERPQADFDDRFPDLLQGRLHVVLGVFEEVIVDTPISPRAFLPRSWSLSRRYRRHQNLQGSNASWPEKA